MACDDYDGEEDDDDEYEEEDADEDKVRKGKRNIR